MAKVWFYKSPGGALVPANDEAQERMKRWKNGALILGEFKEPRNGKHHRKCWVLIQTMFDNQEKVKTMVEFEEMIKLKVGLFDILMTPAGQLYPKTRSIAYDAMDQTEFEQFYQDLITLAIQDGEFFEGKTSIEADAFVNQILGGFA